MNRRNDYLAEREKYFRGKHQHYFLDMPQAASSALADIFELEGVEAIGEPTHYRIRFTHPSHALKREEYIGKMASFVTRIPSVTQYGIVKSEPERRVQGVVRSFSWVGSSREESTFEIVLESRLALLRNTPKVRFFFDMTFPEVMTQVLKENGFDQLQADFKFLPFYYEYRKRPIITQWQEDDLTFIQRLCRRAGIWFVCEAGEHCEIIVFGDDLTHYLRDDGYNMPYRPESGMNDVGVESVDALTMRAISVPTSFAVRSYTQDNGYEPLDATATIHQDPTTYGETYTYGTPFQTKKDLEDEVRVRQQEALCDQVRYEGETNKVHIGPRCVMQLTNRELPDAPHGLLITRTKVTASRKERYKLEFTAIPNELERPYRMPRLEQTWPHIDGTITGTIASPGDYPHPFITKSGGYVVRVHADRDSRKPGLDSCVMYLAKPYAGKHQTGMHFGLVDGTLVAIAFFQGNPDLPYIAHALNSSVHPDPINSEDRWLSRDTIHGRANNTIQFENWPGEQHVKVATEHGKSQLTLGHVVGRNPGREPRGQGYELRSDMKGVVRAGDGLLLTAEAQAKGSGKITDTSGAEQVFGVTQDEAHELARAATAARAEIADLRSENRWLKDELADVKKQVIALSAPAGIGMATPDRMMMAAGKDISVATSSRFNVSAMKHIAMAAREKLSLFAYQFGIGIRAAQGPVQIEAQSDVMSLAAQKDVTVSSVDGAVRVRAKSDMTVECGGAFIEIKDGNMTLGGPGKLTFKFAGMKKSKAEVTHLSAPAFATTVVPFQTRCETWLNGNTAAETVSPSETIVDWKQFANVEASPTAPTYLATDEKASENSNADPDSKYEPKLPTTPKGQTPTPVKLEKPVPCDWKLKRLTKEVETETETGQYKALDNNRQVLVDRNGKPTFAGAVMPASFQVEYDPDAKTVTATVRVKIMPVELVKADPFGNQILTDGKPESIPYHHDLHWDVVREGVGHKTSAGYVMQHRDRVGNSFDLVAQKSKVEGVLNSHRCLLILDGCSRGTACGCRVNVKFKVEFLLSLRGARVDGAHKEVWLFPRSNRADAACWGEENGELKNGIFIASPEGNVVAHECGHLFSFPDEYWKSQGWVHRSYIDANKELDFAKGDANVSEQVWQLESLTNLMGYGALNQASMVSPTYLEYVRKSFSELSNKKWKIGYEA
ncbi:type VI secretion system Vgr family protein [Caballeronia arvi]|uniref:type VI secretion system Vgr family protein n=1 Tax=Caballeronia arvi TaxID=1777135 RepID=UPI00117E1BCF|nr:type VI secretion system Vgr family protein [Caballeronia arvi]